MAFKKGQSGNPGGRAKDVLGVGELARRNGAKAIQRAISLLESDDERVVLAAAQLLLDRGFGKAHQSIEHTGSLEHRHVNEMTEAEIDRELARRGLNAPQKAVSPSPSESRKPH